MRADIKWTVLAVSLAVVALSGCGSGMRDNVFQGRQSWSFKVELGTGKSQESDVQLSAAMTNAGIPLPVEKGEAQCAVTQESGNTRVSAENIIMLEGDGNSVRLGNVILWRKTDKKVQFRLDCDLGKAVLLASFIGAFDAQGRLSGTMYGYVMLLDESGAQRGPFAVENGTFSLSPKSQV